MCTFLCSYYLLHQMKHESPFQDLQQSAHLGYSSRRQDQQQRHGARLLAMRQRETEGSAMIMTILFGEMSSLRTLTLEVGMLTKRWTD